MKTTTAEHYRKRLTQVIEYIYQNLDRNLGVNELADVAHLSPYHFHRIYREMVQETVNATVRRLRLQHAAADLLRTDHSMTHIASAIAYGSQEAFTRAFTQQFGESPKSYRETRQHLCADESSLSPFVAMLPTEPKEYETMYTVEIMDIDSVKLAGLPHQGDYMGIGSVFEKLFIHASSQQLLSQSTRSIGLYYDDPKSVDLDKLRSKACISVDDTTGLSDELEQIEIPAGKCATLLFKGAYAELEKPYDWLFGEWLPKSGYDAADFPPFEEYLNDPKTTPPNELLTRIHCMLA